MKTRPINLDISRRKINRSQIKKELMWVHKNYAFSVYSYCGKKRENGVSKKIIRQTGTGNCISLSYGLQAILKKKYGVQSYVIPATVPEHIRKEGYLDISHVALLVPSSRAGTFYIADPAFYFVNPIKVELKKMGAVTPFTISDIYTEVPEKTRVDYLSRASLLTDEYKLNKYQTIRKNTPVITCSGSTDVSNWSDWNYFATEITNPDSAINSFFMKVWEEKPFITRTAVEKGRVIIKISIHRHPYGGVTIKKRNKVVYQGNISALTDSQIRALDKTFNIPKITGAKFKSFLLKGEKCAEASKN